MADATIVSVFRRSDGVPVRIPVQSSAALALWLRNWRVVDPQTIDDIRLARVNRAQAVSAIAVRLEWGGQSFDITPETGVEWAKDLEAGEPGTYDALRPEASQEG